MSGVINRAVLNIVIKVGSEEELPESEFPKPLHMEGVEPGAGEVVEVVHHGPPVDLGQGQHGGLGPGVQ